ncbi:MAG: signal peptidase I, partial [Lachnospiraceae bacterium]|nr:signal peptidase I [Lachnospiraceae bacterium]
MRRRKRQSLSFHEKPKKKFNIKLFYEIMSWVSGIALAVFLSFMIVMFFGIKTSMVGSSMEPVIVSGQNIYINRVAYNMSSPKRGDVIVFRPNGNSNSHLYIKRVIGLPGERI